MKNIYSIDQVQRRAARWVLQDYGHYNSVTSMQQELNWPILQQCQQKSRLALFCKPMQNTIALQIPTLQIALQNIIIIYLSSVQVQKPMSTCTAIFKLSKSGTLLQGILLWLTQ